MKVAIVAGEKSGDLLGSELVKALQQSYAEVEFVGLGGDLMQSAGVRSLAPMEKISVFGLDGLISGIWEILAIRRRLLKFFYAWQPDIYIGIDVPDFNLGIERKLKKRGVPVVHYVSPTVWAWRPKRIKKIKAAVDLMLVLFPFEAGYYQKHKMRVEFVGHPLADRIKKLQLAAAPRCDKSTRIALLPGSRRSEVERLAKPICDAAELLQEHYAHIEFVMPAASDELLEYLLGVVDQSKAPIKIERGKSLQTMAASDLVITASGTAALEAAMLSKPMVVVYKVSKLSVAIYKNSIVVEHYSMPNHLTKSPIVPELIQDEATAENIVKEMQRLIEDDSYRKEMRDALAEILPQLDQDSGALASAAVVQLLSEHGK